MSSHQQSAGEALLRSLYALSVLVLLCGCATAERMFSPEGYRAEAQSFRAAAQKGERPSLQAAETAAKRNNSREGVLFTLEEARLRALGGDQAGSIRTFQAATDFFERERQQSVVRASEAFFSAAALATNDRFLTYQSAGFERILAHNFLALEFLKGGQADRAQIALNGAIAEMDHERVRERALAERSTQAANRSGISMASADSAMAKVRQELAASALPGLSAYQSAFTFYLSGILFETEGQTDRSTIAFRRAGELYPNHPAVMDALANSLRGDPEDALVVLIVADGWVPLKNDVALPLFWNGTLLQIVMPTYDTAPAQWGAYGAELSIENHPPLRSAVITDIGAQARQSLSDAYPAIFLRQALRLISKYQLQKQLEKESPLAGFTAQVFNLLTDQADLRSWSTLPLTLQVAHASLPAGDHQFSLDGFPTPTPIEATLPPGSTFFIIIEQTGLTHRQSIILIE